VNDVAYSANAPLAVFASHRAMLARRDAGLYARASKFVIIVIAHALVLYALSRETIQQRMMNVVSAQIIAIDLPMPKPVIEPTENPAAQRSTTSQRTVVARTAPATPATPTRSLDLAVVAPQIALNEPTPFAEQQSVSLPAALPSTPAPPPTPAPVPATQSKLELPSSSADYLNNPAPPYPPQSKRLGEQGRVLLHVYVSDAGVPQQIELKQSSGYSRLDEIALATVIKWKFVPGKRNGVAQAMWVNVPIVFELA
jgi:periplasmic protein TonB